MPRFFEDDLSVGQIRFFDHAFPLLDPGEYAVKVTQELDLSGIAVVTDADKSLKKFTFDQKFHVASSHFGLLPADVHAVYPPPNSQGQFDDTLPHIVLRRRSLPWELRLDPQHPERPWCALLLFHEGELTEPPATREADRIHAAAETTVLAPVIPLSTLENQELSTARAKNAATPNSVPIPKARTIDVDKNFFNDICPLPEELDALAHVRQLSTADKELLGLEVDGWFSVVLTNRLPATGVNTVHLVSLEGLSLPVTGPAATTKVRLISLASWSFTTLPARGNFKDLMSNINVEPLQLPLPAGLAASAMDTPEITGQKQLLTGALQSGYVPLAYDLRHGEQSVAWYRGPLLPVVTPREDRAPFPSVEAGTIYDRRTGMFDISYAVAWQIGRLLALSDASFSAGMSKWRQDGHRLLDNILEKEAVVSQEAEGRLWNSVGAITAAGERAAMEAEPGHADEARLAAERPLALQLLIDLLTPGTLSSRLVSMVLQQFDATLSLARAIVGKRQGLFEIVTGVHDTLKVSVGTAPSISIVLKAGSARTTDEIIADLNGNDQFSAVARAVRASNGNGPVAIFALDAAAELKILDGNANSTLGFEANMTAPPAGVQPAAPLIRPAPDTKTGLTAGIAELIATLEQSKTTAAGPAAAKQLRDQLHRAIEAAQTPVVS